MKKCEENPEGPLRFRESGRHRFHPFRYLFCPSPSFSFWCVFFLSTCNVS